MLNSQKIMKIMSTLNFEATLTAKSYPPPQSNVFCQKIWKKSPMQNDLTPKLNARGQRFVGGEGKILKPLRTL